MAPLICEIKMSKESGITVTVLNELAQITQTIHMDGEAITTKVQGPLETSTIVQKQDSIAITCKTFTLDAETITCTSTMDTKHTSRQKYMVESTQDYSVTSQANITNKASLDHSLSGMNVKATANINANIKALNFDIKADVSGKISALMLDESAIAQAKLSAAMVDVSAQGMLKCASGGITDIKGSLVTVSGGLIKLG